MNTDEIIADIESRPNDRIGDIRNCPKPLLLFCYAGCWPFVAFKEFFSSMVEAGSLYRAELERRRRAKRRKA